MAPRIGAPAAFIGFWNWNFQTGLVSLCEKVCDYFNIDEASGRNGVPLERVLAAVDPADRAGLEARLAACRESGAELDAGYHVTSRRFGRRALRTTGQCFRDRTGALAYFSGVVADDDKARHERDSLMTTVDLLLDAREAARLANQPTLVVLIEAVSLEAARALALMNEAGDKN
jgi:hypothetical protein